MRSICLAALVSALLAAPAVAQEVVFLIRHAEKELAGADPALTAKGRERAAAWAGLLKSAGLDAVFTSEARRTKETGGIIAETLNLPQTALPAGDISGLVDTLQFDHEDDRVLIVGHSETIPRILQRFGLPEKLTIRQSDYENLFVVYGLGSGTPTLVRLHMP